MRGILREKIWNNERIFFWNEKFFSQAGQDKVIKNHFFPNKKNGFFLEIGAYDGIEGSNCFHFEKFLNLLLRFIKQPNNVYFDIKYVYFRSKWRFCCHQQLVKNDILDQNIHH